METDLRHDPKARLNQFIFFLLPFLILLLFIYRSLVAPLSDFASYYFGSKLIVTGDYRSAYENLMLNKFILSEGAGNMFVSFTPFTPFTSVIFLPFLILPVMTAKILFTGFSSLLFLFSLRRLFDELALPSKHIFFLLLIFLVPVLNNILFGQAYLLLFCLLSEGFLAYGRKQYFLCSVLWALTILFKVFPAILFLFLLVRRDIRQSIYLVFTTICLFLLSLFVTGTDPWKMYCFEIFPRLGNGELNNSFTFMFQSAFMLLKDLFVFDVLLNPNPLWNSPSIFKAGALLLNAILIASCVRLTLKNENNPFAAFSSWIAVSILISPNGSSYSLILIAFALISYQTSKEALKNRLLVWILLLFVANFPVHILSGMPVLLQYPRLYALLFLFILFLKFHKGIPRLKTIVLFLGLFIFIRFYTSGGVENDKSEYFSHDKKALLISDYSISNNQITYRYLTGEGEKTDSMKFQAASVTTAGLSVDGNQIFLHGKPITHSSDRKLKPLIINNAQLIYLSDKNRGVGMYTIRKLALH